MIGILCGAISGAIMALIIEHIDTRGALAAVIIIALLLAASAVSSFSIRG